MGQEHLDEEFWSQRYRDNEIGWDIGYPSTPLKEYIDQLTNKDLKILIPGCGSGYEAEYLFENDFHNVTVLDLSEEALKRFKERNPRFPQEHIVHGDFFQHNSSYDLILEQTLFCALDPSLRQDYADKVYELLRSGGKLAGVMFQFPLDDGPPYGGNVEEYEEYFSKFSRMSFEECYNSIEPRQGRELFVRIIK